MPKVKLAQLVYRNMLALVKLYYMLETPIEAQQNKAFLQVINDQSNSNQRLLFCAYKV